MPKRIKFRGTEYNFPDAATPEQIESFLRDKASVSAPEPPEPESPGILERVGNAVAPVFDTVVDTVLPARPLELLEKVKVAGSEGDLLKKLVGGFERQGEKISEIDSEPGLAARAKFLSEANPYSYTVGALRNFANSVDTQQPVEPGRKSLVQKRNERADRYGELAAALEAVDSPARRRLGVPGSPTQGPYTERQRALSAEAAQVANEPPPNDIADVLATSKKVPLKPELDVQTGLMFPARAYLHAIEAMYLDPVGAGIMGGQAGITRLASKFLPKPAAALVNIATNLGSAGYFGSDMLRGINEGLEQSGDEGLQQYFREALPAAAGTAGIVTHMARGIGRGASTVTDTVREGRSLKRTEAFLQEKYQSGAKKRVENEQGGKPLLANHDEGELVAYFEGDGAGKELRRTQNVDDLSTAVRGLFSGRPDTKVTIHENWDSVPENLRPRSPEALETIPSLIDKSTGEIHFIRTGQKTGSGLARNVRHEVGHAVDDFSPVEIVRSLPNGMRQQVALLAQEGRLPMGEANRIAGLSDAALAAEVKAMSANPETAWIPQTLATEAVARIAQDFRVQPSKVSLLMAKAARAMGLQMTPSDIRAIMSERIEQSKAGERAPDVGMRGTIPETARPDYVPPAEPAPARTPAKGDTVYLPSSDPSIRLQDSGTITSIKNDGTVVVRVGKGFIREVRPEQVSFEPLPQAREGTLPPDQVADIERSGQIARQQRAAQQEVEAGRQIVGEAIEAQRPLIDKVVEQPLGAEERQLAPGADIVPGLLDKAIEPQRGDPFALSGEGKQLKATTTRPPAETVDPLMPNAAAGTEAFNLSGAGESKLSPPDKRGSAAYEGGYSQDGLLFQNTADSSKSLPDMPDNYRKDLSFYTDRLYHEGSVERLLEVLPNTNVSTDLGELFFANSPLLARGQGDNRGILMEFASPGIEGRVNTQKPAWNFAYKNGEAEFRVALPRQADIQGALRAFTIPRAVYPRATRLRHAISLADGLVARGEWTKTILDDGSVRYSKTHSTAAPTVNFQNTADDYKFNRPETNEFMDDATWAKFADDDATKFNLLPDRRHEKTDADGIARLTDENGTKVFALYDGDRLLGSASLAPHGLVRYIRVARGAWNPERHPFWNLDDRGKYLAIRDRRTPFMNLQREMARNGVVRGADDALSPSGARNLNDRVIPDDHMVNTLRGFEDSPSIIAGETGLPLDYVGKGIADLKGGKYDSIEAFEVMDWVYDKIREQYEIDRGLKPASAGVEGRTVQGVPGDRDNAGDAEAAPGGGVGAGRTAAGAAAELAPFPQAEVPLPPAEVAYQNTDADQYGRAPKSLLDPMRGTLLQLGASVIDKHPTIESFVSKMSEGLGGGAKLSVQQMAASIFEDVKTYKAEADNAKSILDALRSKAEPKKQLGTPEAGAARDILKAVDAAKEEAGLPARKDDAKTIKQATAWVESVGADGVMDRVLEAVRNHRQLEDYETLGARLAFGNLADREAALSDPKSAVKQFLMAAAYRQAGTEQARAFRMRRWDIGPEGNDRVRHALFDVFFDPKGIRDNAIAAEAREAITTGRQPSGRATQKIMRHIAKVREFLEKEIGVKNVSDIPDGLLTDPVYMKNLVDKWSHKSAGVGAKMRTWYLNSILSAPKTQVANITGNTLNFVTEYYGHLRAEALINDLFAAFKSDTGGVRSSDLKGLMSQLIRVQDMSFRQAAELGKIELDAGGGLMGRAGKDAVKFWKTREAQLRSRIEKRDWVDELREKKQSFGGKSGKIIQAPTKALGFADEFMKSLTGHMEALISARRIARVEGKAVGSDGYNSRVTELLSDYGSAAWAEALDRAEYMTFQREGGKLVKSLLAFRHAHPWTSFIVPFITTPVNLFSRAFEFVPGLGMMYRGRHGQTVWEAKGTDQGSYKSRMIAAQAMGAAATLMIGALGLDAFKEGEDEPWITGSEPPPKFSQGEREARRRTLQPYTVKNPFGEGRISYKRLDPLSTSLAVSVDFTHALRDFLRHKDPSRAGAILKQSLLGQAVGKTFLQTPGEVIEWIQDKPGTDPLGPAKTVASGFYPNLFRSAANSFFDPFVREQRNYGAKEGELGMDPLERQAKTFAYKTLNIPELPGVGTLVEPKATVYGDRVKRGGSGPYRFLSPFDIYTPSSETQRNMDLRFLRSVETLPDAPDSLPVEMSPKARLGGQTIALRPEDFLASEEASGRLYSEILRNAGIAHDPTKPLTEAELEIVKRVARKVRPYGTHTVAPKYLGGR